MVNENELNQMVTINVKWIDVEDELPDEEDFYWVTFLDTGDNSLGVSTDLYHIDDRWQGWDTFDDDDNELIAVAWAKINNPEPYRWSKTEEEWNEKIAEEMLRDAMEYDAMRKFPEFFESKYIENYKQKENEHE